MFYFSLYPQPNTIRYAVTPEVLAQLIKLRVGQGKTVLQMRTGWQARRCAVVMGRRFTAGEPLRGVRHSNWEARRCGSLITTVVKGKSRYGLVQHFIEKPSLTDVKFAVVKWLPPASYPYANPCVVFLRDGDVCDEFLPCLLSILDIDACGVCFERCDRLKGLYVCRTHGLDTNPIFKF